VSERTRGENQRRGRSLQGWSAPDGIETFYEVRSRDSLLPPDQFSRLPRRPVHIVLDNLRSAFNVGSIFRLADAARVAEVVACGYTAHPPNHKLEQTSLGTDRSVPWRWCESTLEAIRELRRSGCHVLAVETASPAVPFHKYDYRFPAAVVFGNEALGIQPAILAECDGVIDIPVAGFKNSINVATAAAVVLYELLRQGNWLDPDGRTGLLDRSDSGNLRP
jgi:23S rRNA (guanosine2251-2'-O)-methyltransferase